MTLDTLAGHVRELPLTTRQRLANGPDPHPEECAVCELLVDTQLWLRNEDARELANWHSGFDLADNPASRWTDDDAGKGPVTYDRALLIYLAAGWRP